MKFSIGQELIVGLLLIIFVSGFLIFGWNYIHGVNLLEEKPNFDLSYYDDPSNVFGFNPEVDKEFLQTFEVEPVQAESVITKQILFKDFFVKETDELTQQNILDFLTKFENLEFANIELLPNENVFEIELPVEGRQELLQKLEQDENILFVRIKQAPIWEVGFAIDEKQTDIEKMLSGYPEIILKDKVTNYIAEAEVVAKNQVDLDLLEKYNDVLEIK